MKTTNQYLPWIQTQTVLSQILARRVQQYVKKKTHHDQVGFIPGMCGWFRIWKSIHLVCHIKKLEKKNQTNIIISIDVEESFDKNQHTFMIWKKPLSKLRIKGNSLYQIKSIYEKLMANTTLNAETEQGNVVLTASVQHCFGGPWQHDKAGKK